VSVRWTCACREIVPSGHYDSPSTTIAPRSFQGLVLVLVPVLVLVLVLVVRGGS